MSDLVSRKGVLESSASKHSASARVKGTHGDASLTCIITILERLIASGHVHQIAKNLVGQIQGDTWDTDPVSIPVTVKVYLILFFLPR